ncbi:MAG TPA: P1 family peptidase [Thermoanaerobaculia bacterium]|nr:P1 family peptidase [Thermoanaerobaculia bacterium]
MPIRLRVPRQPRTQSTIFFAVATLLLLLGAMEATAANRHRARDLGVPFDGAPGPLNAITDVVGVEVGQVTLVVGEGSLVVGQGPVRTGVTAILPRGKHDEPVPAGWFSLNGNGEMTGTAWLEESGFLEGPILLTNTHSVGVVRDAVVEWGNRRFPGTDTFSLPVVAETWDGYLNDINGFHVTKEHALRALDTARSGPVEEGSVGGGTGMRAHGFKAGIGTSSRKLGATDGAYIVGVLVQANCCTREELRIAGVPVGREIPDLQPVVQPQPGATSSIIIVVATDAPLLPHQLKRLARRAALGLARDGSTSANTSGDLFVAFSTAQPAKNVGRVDLWSAVPNDSMNPLFTATVQATEEAIVNALVAADTMTGINGNTFYALPHDRLKQILAKYGRLAGVP